MMVPLGAAVVNEWRLGLWLYQSESNWLFTLIVVASVHTCVCFRKHYYSLHSQLVRVVDLVEVKL
jgi:hypothetical protein